MEKEQRAVRSAVITGAGSGIGRAVALTLASNGFGVVLAGRRFAEIEKTAEQAQTGGAQAIALSTDVSNAEQVAALFRKATESFGRVDLLFNNAGANTPPLPINELTLEQWNKVVAVNLTGAFLCAQAAVRVMKAQTPRGGRIINNGSISAHVPRPNAVAYTATKHAITGLTRSLSLDGRSFDIACGQIDIGNAATEMTRHMTEPTIDVQHVADAVLYMANLPLNANVQFMTVMATAMPFIGRG